MKKLAFSIFFALLLLSVSEASAQTASKFYVRLDAGGSFPMDTNLAGFTGFSPSAVVDAGVGFKILPFLRTDVTVSYRPDYNQNTTDPNTFVQQKADIKSLASFFNAYFDIPTGPLPVTPYIGAGVGVSRNQTGSTFEADTFGNTISVSGATKTNFAYQVTAGLSFPIFVGIAFDASYHYVDLGRFTTGSSANLNGAGVTVVPESGRLKANEVMIGLRIGF
jgi:opacity protein-like surface antigen